MIPTSQSTFSSLELEIKSGLIQAGVSHFLGWKTWGQKTTEKPSKPHTENGVCPLTRTQTVSLCQQTKSIIKLDISKPPDPQ